jgi:hypothetical protein
MQESNLRIRYVTPVLIPSANRAGSLASFELHEGLSGCLASFDTA